MKLDIKTKEELLNHMRASREFNTFGKTSGWKLAFQMHRDATGMKLKMNCPKCFTMVKEWLLQ
jgi:hypothetical protein